MTKLNKLRLTMAGLLCGGMLIIGIGTGIGFGEVSQFSYAGSQMVGDNTSKSFSSEVELFHPKGQVYLHVPYLDELSETPRIVVSETVAPGTVHVDATYLSSISVPQIYHNNYYSDTDEVAEESLYLSSSASPVALLFSYKDAVLKDLKAHQLGDYREFAYTDLVLTVNPADKDRIVLM